MAPAARPNTAIALSWSVGGMDCAGCAAKVRRAVERLPGAEEVAVSVMSEKLTLTLDEARTGRDAVETEVRRLGYSIAPVLAAAPAAQTAASCCGSSRCAEAHVEPEPAKGLWALSPKLRLVLATGVLLLLAWATELLAPEGVSVWAFTLAALLGVAPVARRAAAALRAGMPFTIEMLMVIATLGALAIGAVGEAAMVVFLFAVGEALEGVAAEKARSGIRSLAALAPKTAILLEDGAQRSVDASSLQIGQTILVRPGDRIAADGEIVDGASSVNEAAVTGESAPKAKTAGEGVFAGSINQEGALQVRVTRAQEDNTLARIIRLVEEAQEARAPTERFIDRFSRYYMPAVVLCALIAALLPPLAFGQPWETWIYRGLALLLIGCPCALVISVPASIASALSAGARRGLLLKGGAVIETTARTQVVAFDKTGTLTRGQPVVTDVVDMDAEGSTLALAAGLEAASSHPLAEAILRHAETRGAAPAAVEALTAVPGRGLSGRVGGAAVFLGSPRYAEESGALTPEAHTQIATLEADGKTVVVVFDEQGLTGLIALRDEPREDAADGVAALTALGVRSVMLTGDNARTAEAIAGPLGVEHRAGLLPEDKVAEIRTLSERHTVMMVGDGVNDAPALATAHVGVAMGSGTDVALETADGAILRNRVGDVAAQIRLARATMANIRQNIALALGLKGVFLITSVIGVTGLWIAILADTGATVLVTLNALRLLSFEGRRRR